MRTRKRLLTALIVGLMALSGTLNNDDAQVSHVFEMKLLGSSFDKLVTEELS